MCVLHDTQGEFSSTAKRNIKKRIYKQYEKIIIIRVKDEWRLDTRVINVNTLLQSPRTPSSADIIDKAGISDGLPDLLLTLNELQCKAHSHVPTNMAVHEPNTRVIGEEGNDEMTALSSRTVTRHERYITTRRVVKVDRGATAIVAVSCCEDVEVVTVQMDGVAEWDGRLDDDVDPLSERCGDSEIARVRRNGVVVDDAVESCVTPVGLEGGAVEVPAVEVDTVGVGDGDIVLHGLVGRADCLLEDRN